MSSEVTRDLSVKDLLRALGEKLSLESTRIREIPSHVASTTELASEVSTFRPILIPAGAVVGSDSSGLCV